MRLSGRWVPPIWLVFLVRLGGWDRLSLFGM